MNAVGTQVDALPKTVAGALAAPVTHDGVDDGDANPAVIEEVLDTFSKLEEEDESPTQGAGWRSARRRQDGKGAEKVLLAHVRVLRTVNAMRRRTQRVQKMAVAVNRALRVAPLKKANPFITEMMDAVQRAHYFGGELRDLQTTASPRARRVRPADRRRYLVRLARRACVQAARLDPRKRARRGGRQSR